jgi:GLPGLI family protein
VFNNISYAQILVATPLPRNTSNMGTIDSGNIRILYALNAADINNPEIYDDLHRLEIGEHLSKYYSYFIYNSDSLCTEWRKKHPNAESLPNRMGVHGKQKYGWSEYYYSEYFKDFFSNTFTEYARMPAYMQNYNCQYSEILPAYDWKIRDDTLTVTDYLCQKAECSFRGRNYIAWFTVDIPVNNGPWKFGGLPGLIMKIYDSDKLYVFECVSVETYKKRYPIKIYDYNSYVKIDRKKLLNLQKNIKEDFFQVLGIISKSKYTKIPYHPLELE